MLELTPEQIEAIEESDVLCACGANPRAAQRLQGWRVEIRNVASASDLGPIEEVTVWCPACASGAQVRT